RLGRYYAQALIHNGPMAIDMIFGPAYKGIPLAAATSISLADSFDIDLPYCFIRKEAKAHGEGGSLVGAPLQDKVDIVDDVITAGTAMREVMQSIKAAGAQPAAVMVALDRQERGQGELSAIQEVERDFGVPVISIVSLTQILAFLEDDAQLRKYL